MNVVMAVADQKAERTASGTAGRHAAAFLVAVAVVAGTLLAPPLAAGDPPTDPYATRVLDRPSLVSYWRLGETSGTTADDLKNGRDGAYDGNFALGVPGALSGDADTATSFGGGRVAIPMMPSSTDFTVEGWMRLGPDASSNNNLYGALGALRLMPRPTAYYAGVWVGGTEYKLQGSSPSNVGTWVHWALIREGSRLRLYRNGALLGETNNLPATGETKLDGNIGRLGNIYPVQGEIDEVSVNSAALSAAEVEGDYLSESVPAGEAPPPPPPGATTYVDGASLGGACNDAHTVAQAASPVTPWCTLGRAAELAGAGSTVLVRQATYRATKITGQARAQAITFKPFATEAPVLDGLTVTQSSGLRFEGFRVTDQTTLDGVVNVALLGNDVSPHGVSVGSGRELTFEDNSFHDLTMELDPASGRCVPPRCGYGIRITTATGVTIRDNLFSDIPGDGIQSGTATNYLIAGNEFERISAFVDPNEHSDSIQFYRGSNGVTMSGNYFHDTRGPLLLGSQSNEAHHGLVITNNTIVRQRDWGIKVHDSPGLVLANNTVWDAGPNGVAVNDTSAVTAATTDVRAYNNVIEQFSAQPGQFAFEDYNLIGAGLRGGSHDLAGPPRFANPVSLDYTLQGASPAVDSGLSTDAPQTDRIGQARFDQPAVPNTGGGAEPYYDMGALEFAGSYTPPAGSYSQMILGTPNLLSYWRLGESSGSTAVDIKAGRNGEYQGAHAKGAAGAISGDPDHSVTLNGGRIDVPVMPSSVDFTVEGWMRLSTKAGKNSTLYGQQGALRLMPRKSGFYVGVWLSGTEHKIATSGASNVGKWVHWALVRDGGTLLVYRNGSRVSQKSVPSSPSANLSGDIARLGGSYPTYGEIDEVAVYGRALSATQISARYDLGS